MPINDGEVTLVTRNLARDARKGIDALAKMVLAADRKALAAAYAVTDVAFRAFHSERYRTTAEGALLAAREEFGIPVLTETPIDRWMRSLR